MIKLDTTFKFHETKFHRVVWALASSLRIVLPVHEEVCVPMCLVTNDMDLFGCHVFFVKNVTCKYFQTTLLACIHYANLPM